MDEIAKTEARNYLSAAGFFVFGACELLWIICLTTNTLTGFNSTIDIVGGVALLLVATLLIVLRKRDMIALLFTMLGFLLLYWMNAPSQPLGILSSAFAVLVTVVTLTSKDKQKWLVFMLPLVLLITNLFQTCVPVFTVLMVIAVVLSLYYSFCCASERVNLPGRKLLIADEQTDFKASGSVLGYMLFALVFAGWSVFNFAGGSAAFPLEHFQTIELICSFLMLFVAILLITVGKMRFTPVMFLLIGFTTLLGIYSSGAMFFGIAILYLVMGLFAILRKESRILPGIMFLFTAAAYFIVGGAGVGVPVVVLGMLNAVAAAIAVYLSFVVYSQRKLPKF